MKHNPITGRFTGPSQTAEERFWPKVKKTKDCWIWTAAHIPLGYGVFWDGKRLTYAHIFCYELLVGKVPPERDLDHLCRNPVCVNPEHLEPVTHKVNMQRGQTGLKSGEQQRSKTHCPKGHPYDDKNTYINPTTKARHCRACRSEWNKSRR